MTSGSLGGATLLLDLVRFPAFATGEGSSYGRGSAGRADDTRSGGRAEDDDASHLWELGRRERQGKRREALKVEQRSAWRSGVRFRLVTQWKALVWFQSQRTLAMRCRCKSVAI
jgi:hypothetical protein